MGECPECIRLLNASALFIFGTVLEMLSISEFGYSKIVPNIVTIDVYGSF